MVAVAMRTVLQLLGEDIVGPVVAVKGKLEDGKRMEEFLPVEVHMAADHWAGSEIVVHSWEEEGIVVVEGTLGRILVLYWEGAVDMHLVEWACHDIRQGRRFPVPGLVAVAGF
jgi:hypothetical protein